jgi:hypothetical protein
LAHPRDTSRAIAQASLCFCIASKGPRNEPSLENNGNFHKVILKKVCKKLRLSYLSLSSPKHYSQIHGNLLVYPSKFMSLINQIQQYYDLNNNRFCDT